MSAKVERVLSRARSLARAKRDELLTSKRGHARRVLGILVGVALDDGRVAGGRALLEAARFTCAAHLRLTAPRQVGEATAQLVFLETAVDFELVRARAVEDVDVARRPRRSPMKVDAEVTVERVRAGDAEPPVGELRHRAAHGAQRDLASQRHVLVTGDFAHTGGVRGTLVFALNEGGAVPVGTPRAAR